MQKRTIAVLCCGATTLALAGGALAASMRPAVRTFMPMSAAAGAKVTITGADLTGTRSVKFGGTSTMHFSVVSATKIVATVPKGAKKGPISVTTAAGTSHSMDSFTPRM